MNRRQKDKIPAPAKKERELTNSEIVVIAAFRVGTTDLCLSKGRGILPKGV
jgi:hypothetical protein